MRVFKNGWFAKFARKERISDRSLCEAVARAQAGLVDADLGGGLIKQRVARPGAGKSGGYRTLIFFRIETRAVFAFGFAKNDKANLNAAEEAAFKTAARPELDDVSSKRLNQAHTLNLKQESDFLTSPSKIILL